MTEKKPWPTPRRPYGFGLRSTGMMKKMTALLTGAVLTFAIVACSSNGAGAPTSTAAGSSSAIAMASPSATAVASSATAAMASPSATVAASSATAAMGSDRGGPPLTPGSQDQTSRVTFPANFDQMVMYGDYRRGSGGELAYALPETIATAKADQPLPAGTVLVLEIYGDNALTAYFVMEKGVDWGLAFPEELRTGDWHFQEFDGNRQVRVGANINRCISCHQQQASNDFMYTLERMRSYLP